MSLLLPKKTKFASPWITKEIKNWDRKKRKAWKNFIASGRKNVQHLNRHKFITAKIKKLSRNAKRNFERNLAKKKNKNKKAFFSHLKKMTKVKPSIGPLKNEQGEIVVDNQNMAEILNDFFTTVFTVEDVTNIPKVEALFTGDMPLTTMFFDRKPIAEKLKALKPNSAPGPDKIHPQFLNKCADELAIPLQIIFNKSITSGDVPSDWRVANITPIFKKGSKASPNNYRPVSLTSVVCKVFESLIKDIISGFLKANKLLFRSQHGFIEGRSVVTNLLTYLEHLTKSIDNGIPVDVIYLDFAKAFDKVPIERLLAKCEGLGIRGQFLNWIRNWLTDRKQRVVLNGDASSWKPVTSGVPQGSVLGPLLFLIFINDIDLAVDIAGGLLSKFADDTKFVHRVDTLENRQKMQDGINKLNEWATLWQMTFNLGKCSILHLGHNNPRHDYTMGGEKLGTVASEKDIGINIHESLKPSLHCAMAAKKANSVLGQLARGITFRDKETFIPLYCMYVRPHLEGAAQAWSPWLAGDIEVLENVQRRAFKMVTNFKAKSYEDKLKEVNQITLQARRIRGDMCEVYKILTNINDVDHTDWFELLDESERVTRNRMGYMNLKRNVGRLEIRHNFFSCRVVGVWNSIPDAVKAQPNLNCFKNALDNFAQHSGFYENWT